jgi:hypothetical protein
MGQAIRGGTAFSQILLDDQMLPELLKEIDVEKNKLEDEEEGDLSHLEDTDIISGPCASTQFQMNMVIPQGKAIMEEPDIEVNILE